MNDAPAALDGAVSDTQTPRKAKKKSKPKTTSLPPLQIAPGAQRLGLRGGPPALNPGVIPPAAVAAISAPGPRRKLRADDAPFAPTGIDVGGLRLSPTIEEDVGFATNPNLLAGSHRASGFETTEVGLVAQSDWSRHELHGQLRAGYTDYFSQSGANAPFGSGSLGGRLDVTKDASLDGEARFSVTTQTPGSVTLPSGAVLSSTARPLVTTLGATIGGTQRLGVFSFGLHGALDHTSYQDATLASGAVDRLSSDNFADWGLRARAAYRASPVVAPFVEVAGDLRRYDSSRDSNGYQRNSAGGAARGGVELALSKLVAGEVSAGYSQRHYEDARLQDLRGPVIDAAIIWSATPLTTITFKAQSLLAETTTAGVSGALQRSYTIDVSHALLRNLNLGANAGLTTNAYSGNGGHDKTLTLGLKAEYDLGRDVVLKASAQRSQFTSSLPGSNYVANVFMLGLKLQR